MPGAARPGINSSRDRLALFRVAWLTLLNKIRRDGPKDFIKTLARVCFSEQPFAAIARHREVIAFFDQPLLAPLKSMAFANKYLSGYLAKSLNKRARREVLLHHYRALVERAEPDFLKRIVSGAYLLWSKESDLGAHSIMLTFNPLHYEGDLSVVFESDGERISEISFAIVPGSAIDSFAPELLFIGRVQGAKDRFTEIKRATKLCCDVTPQYMLMIAIQSIARSLGITAVAGVTDENLVATDPNIYYRFGYNAFWENWAERPTARNFYEMPVPLPRTALHAIKASHRRRTRKKRSFKDEVAEEIAARLRSIFRQGAHSREAD